MAWLFSKTKKQIWFRLLLLLAQKEHKMSQKVVACLWFAIKFIMKSLWKLLIFYFISLLFWMKKMMMREKCGLNWVRVFLSLWTITFLSYSIFLITRKIMGKNCWRQSFQGWKLKCCCNMNLNNLSVTLKIFLSKIIQQTQNLSLKFSIIIIYYWNKRIPICKLYLPVLTVQFNITTTKKKDEISFK